jgi:hypothetical protein
MLARQFNLCTTTQTSLFTITTTGFPAPKLTKAGALPRGITFIDN